MADSDIAVARRLFLHVKDGGSVTAMDMSRLVAAMERLERQRDVAQAERHRLASELSEAHLTIVKLMESAAAANYPTH